jgi:hypothetical protein
MFSRCIATILFYLVTLQHRSFLLFSLNPSGFSGIHCLRIQPRTTLFSWKGRIRTMSRTGKNDQFPHVILCGIYVDYDKKNTFGKTPFSTHGFPIILMLVFQFPILRFFFSQKNQKCGNVKKQPWIICFP